MTRELTNNGVFVPLTPEEINNILLEKYNEVTNRNYTPQQWALTPDGIAFGITAQYGANAENDYANIAGTVLDYLDKTDRSLAPPPTTDDSIILAFTKAGYTVGIDCNASGALLAVFKEGIDLTTSQIERDKVAQIYNDHLAGGIQALGALTGNVILDNGQQKSMSFDVFEDKMLFLNYEIEYLAGTSAQILTETQIKELVLNNFKERYRRANAVTPDLYLTFNDAKFATNIIAKWSEDNVSYFDSTLKEPYNFNRLLTLDDITVVLTEV